MILTLTNNKTHLTLGRETELDIYKDGDETYALSLADEDRSLEISYLSRAQLDSIVALALYARSKE